MNTSDPSPAIGVFICHCGTNIAGTVDVPAVTEYAGTLPDVVVSRDYMFMCSDMGSRLISDCIREHGLDRVVVASCSPRMHEPTFRRAVEKAGLNPYCLEMANIREHCSWVHTGEPERATEKAEDLVRMAVSKARLLEPLDKKKLEMTPAALVIGAGIAGIQASLDIAEQGVKVYLVEREPSIGGRMAQLDKTFPTLDCSSCILTPKMMDVGNHPNIELLTYSEVVKVEGSVGNFKVRIKRKARYVDEDKCTGCNKCSEVCPVVVPSEFNRGLGPKKAIYLSFPQAVPQVYTLDDEACLGLLPLACSKCSEVCEPGAIDYDQQAVEMELEVGAIIAATGYDLTQKESIGEYGYGRYEDVIDSLEFERLVSAVGPTGGRVRRPSDGKTPKEIVFIQCVGSRDPEHGVPYCSKICCMYTAKHAFMYKHAVPDGQAYVFYIDIRSGGKGYEEFVQRVVEEDTVLYLRGKVSKVYEEDGKIVVWGADTLSGRKVEIRADLVVLALATKPRKDAGDLARLLKISTGADGFFLEAHPKLRPMDTLTDGIFVAGSCQGPKDIPETVAQGSGAAARACTLLTKDFIEIEPTISHVVDENCDGCAYCIDPCPFGALTLIEYMKKGDLKKTVEVDEGICKGCGVCMATCPKAGIFVKHFKPEMLSAMVKAALE